MQGTPKEFLRRQIAGIADGLDFDVLVPPNPELGDYSTNVAFLIAKKEGKRPVDVANAVIQELDVSEVFERKIAPNGFINFYIKSDFLNTYEFNPQSIGNQKKVIVEYSSPNIAKPMHIGHLRSTIIGDALANVYEKLGYDVIRWNYIGDWGTQFGKVIAGYKKWGQSLEITMPNMLDWYVQASKELTEDEGQKEFKKLEEGDSENRELWEKFRRVSIHELQKNYQELNIHNFDQYKGESDYELKLRPLIEELQKKGLAKESEGALIVELNDMPPLMLRKSDGATLYATRDLASLEDRIENYHPAKILYVVANQQALHFEQLFAVAAKLGWNSSGLAHVKFGMVLGTDGKKLATREGKVVLLGDVLAEATTKAAAVVKEKNPAISEEEVQKIAHVIAIGGLKYNDLKQHPHTDIKFDWKSMLDFAGNSGPYLQYTYARFANILAKAGSGDWEKVSATSSEPEAELIKRHLIKYSDTLVESTVVNTLSGLALYLYELAALMSRFYENVRVLDEKDSDKKNARLRLIKVASDTLKEGLQLLGIQTLDRI